ncbi:hypothetical protein S1OALGB6SA_1117 [Olavius algarvensis spirochete endosymbiont]|uniref:FeoA family protein n=1 Tax=Olavius algarvensis spirochete endosymbiont TaxID=260710 RepID=UPI00052B716E|nr:FeoA domain-containing protein [Olavius algarvensis spirochete endosymbiont]KGM38602.1 hypothetical protein JY97_15255 [Alkalispirochaeta odontotermitis]VDB00044.1 hypothetical protein S1OALGB6SA_1117 [Olavius algarvensis spirochete endosymbiont]
MELTAIDKGKKAVVLRIEGGKKYREKLMNLGIIPGVPVRVIRRASRNPMLLTVMDRQVILGHDIAEKIIVNQLPRCEVFA